ncbi:uncharacterized protein LOC116921571 [Daphnia magna]|uniref:CUB domain-containing protein n=1 Tax=Daphnia magna TaxID=35525 RepID=A0A0P5W3E5_9CRUS|nr:uncharacterized protein LOC116921571 [Daphnia magna]KZS17498.1 Uncharacterized protein APZ42_016356 [Daphnia magna]
MKPIAFSSQKVIDGCRVQQQQTTRFDIRKMLLPLIVLSVLIELPTNSAFNQSELVRIPRHNYYGAEPSLYYTNFNPFRPYWLNRPHYLDNFGGGGMLDPIQGRSRLSSRLGLTPVRDELEEEISSRLLGKAGMKQGNTQGNSFFSMRNPLATYEPCGSSNGEEDGICLAGPVCSFYGGRATGGNCRRATTCCVNEVSKCGALVTLNNTYWQAPAAVSSESTCGLTVKMDRTLIEQRVTTCQLRLDFISFSISQPNAQSVCNVDSLQIAGTINKVPIICGDNDGQHMYLTLPHAAASAQLVFTFGTSTAARTWRIKIAMLPCGSDYLAPNECLQYFTTAIGSVMTFNWKDVATGTSTRQLANQDYYICFRTELVNKQSSAQVATVLCVQECQTSAAKAFSISGTDMARSQTLDDTSCNNDFLLFPGGTSHPTVGTVRPRDRFCGTVFAQESESGSTQTICSTVKPFRMFYRTNGDETITATVDSASTGNQGFCLAFEHRLT